MSNSDPEWDIISNESENDVDERHNEEGNRESVPGSPPVSPTDDIILEDIPSKLDWPDAKTYVPPQWGKTGQDPYADYSAEEDSEEEEREEEEPYFRSRWGFIEPPTDEGIIYTDGELYLMIKELAEFVDSASPKPSKTPRTFVEEPKYWKRFLSIKSSTTPPTRSEKKDIENSCYLIKEWVFATSRILQYPERVRRRYRLQVVGLFEELMYNIFWNCNVYTVKELEEIIHLLIQETETTHQRIREEEREEDIRRKNALGYAIIGTPLETNAIFIRTFNDMHPSHDPACYIFMIREDRNEWQMSMDDELTVISSETGDYTGFQETRLEDMSPAVLAGKTRPPQSSVCSVYGGSDSDRFATNFPHLPERHEEPDLTQRSSEEASDSDPLASENGDDGMYHYPPYRSSVDPSNSNSNAALRDSDRGRDSFNSEHDQQSGNQGAWEEDVESLTVRYVYPLVEYQS